MKHVAVQIQGENGLESMPGIARKVVLSCAGRRMERGLALIEDACLEQEDH